MGSQLCRYQLTESYILEMTFLSTASAAPQREILERDNFPTRFPPLQSRFLLSPAQQHDLSVSTDVASGEALIPFVPQVFHL